MSIDWSGIPRPEELWNEAESTRLAQLHLSRIADELRQHHRSGEVYTTTIPGDVNGRTVRRILDCFRVKGWACAHEAVMLSTGDSAWKITIQEDFA